jgi:excinuclease ABC subunit A
MARLKTTSNGGIVDHIRIRGAAEHNLKDINVDIPRDSLVVITGLSGSGKSSLAYDTVYQEGQRRFMESLSSYARQFLGQMEKPRVERVDGLSPTLSIDQKTVNRNPRSTVGTITEILDHLRLLMARLGTPKCPICDHEISVLSPAQIADRILKTSPEAKLHVMSPIVWDRKGEYRKELREALQDGFIRARIDGELRSLEDDIQLARYEKHTIELVVDRLRAKIDRRPRLIEAIETALEHGNEKVTVLIEDTHHVFSAARSCPEHGISIPEMEPRLFSFNAPQGACETCNGLGKLEDFDLDRLIDVNAGFMDFLPVLEGDVRLPFTTLCRPTLKQIGEKLGINPQTPFKELTTEQQSALLYGADVTYKTERERDDGKRKSTSRVTWSGVLPAVRRSWKWSKMKRLGAQRTSVVCPDCHGHRLNSIARAVDFRGKNITDLSVMTINDARSFFAHIDLEGETEQRIGTPILQEILSRLGFLEQVGLGYLSIDRSASTLSGGEAQRIRLSSQVGAGLQGVTYILDEPSIGLHPRDLDRLLDALIALRDKGNTVIVVEHDPETMRRADFILEVGPGAGRLGGEIVAAGKPKDFLKKDTLTARYLRGEEGIPLPSVRRSGNGKKLVIRGAQENNLKNIDVHIPLGTFIAVTGVSGSGKSTLMMDILHRALAMELHDAGTDPGKHDSIDGIEHIDKVVRIDQAPIGRTPRSNPATYTGIWDEIRNLFSQVSESRTRGYTKSRFSFNVTGGRCEACTGAGVKTIAMQFLSDVEVPCDVCQARRFNSETLEIRYRGHTIHDILQMTISEAKQFFQRHRKINRILTTLDTVGLGYIALGQTSTTLSGGEAQRIKLATELHRPATGQTLYLLDEPTTGLHMADIKRLLGALQALVEQGNTVMVIEHNTDVIKVADHIIDLGPEGGAGGGQLIGSGSPESVATQQTPTGSILRDVLDGAEPITIVENTTPTHKKRSTDIQLRGVHTHNLQGIDVDIPQGAMTVITGVSGSGKTSLAFDTLFAEGQRRYVESLSTYARRFLGRLSRAPVDSAEGLAPAIAIDQRNRSHNPRSTVATVTEIYDTLRLLYARIGHPHCPKCDTPLHSDPPSDAGRSLQTAAPGPGWLVSTLPLGVDARDLITDGYTRAWNPKEEGKDRKSAEVNLEPDTSMTGLQLVIDRFNPGTTEPDRIADSIVLAYGYGAKRARFIPKKGEPISLALAAECSIHGTIFPDEITPRHFSFNSHTGACTGCDGLGKRAEIDPHLVVPKPHRKLRDALDKRVASVVFRSKPMKAMLAQLYKKFGTTQDTPYEELTPQFQQDLLYGHGMPLEIRWTKKWGRSVTRVNESREWPGIIPTVNGWKGRDNWIGEETTCSACKGARLKPAFRAVRIDGQGVHNVCAMTVEQAHRFWSNLSLSEHDETIAEQAIVELRAKLGFLLDVGLGYLTLDRSADTLSGGEAQRIRLATQLGARLTGTIYVLDEPTVGLHQRDTERLLGTLKELRDLGNTLIVVEHDPDVMNAADYILDLGPAAGEFGGTIVGQGTPDTIAGQNSQTADFLTGQRVIASPKEYRVPTLWIDIPAATRNNLTGFSSRIPRRCLTVVSGVSGSGKSSYVMDTLAPYLEERRKARKAGPARIVVVNQRPIGRTPRSTPATYAKILDPIRQLFAQTPQARALGYGPERFTFNGKTGRCPHCEGRGAQLIEMHFLSDVWIQCERCNGSRFSESTRQVMWREKNIADVLQMSVTTALDFFAHHRPIARRLQPLEDVGLGYLRLGQPATTLSGGEAQRLKLATELIGRKKETCFLLDEPTTGLHFSDIEKLLGVLHRLVDAGHMIVVIEHHLDVIKNADHLIDLGPEGGSEGGRIVALGTPKEVAQHKTSWTARALTAHNAI